MVVLTKPDANGAQQVVVVNATTGRTTGRVPDPVKGTTWYQAAAAWNGSTFVLAAAPLAAGDCATYLFTLTLSASGIPASLTPWAVPVVKENIIMLAASADGGVLAFGAEQCRDPDEVIGVIRGHAVKTWQTTYPLDFASLSISADGNLLAFSTARLGGGSHQHPQARLLDTSAKPGSAAAASTLLYTYPAGAVVPAVVLAPDAATAYFQWITGGHESMLTGYRIGPDGLSGEQFSDTLPAEQRLAWAGNRLAVWLGPPFSLVDPATGATSLVRAPWTNDYQIAW